MSVWSLRFTGGAPAAGQARHAVRAQLSGELSERRMCDVELLVSELATNSIRHAGCAEDGEISVEADMSEERIHLRLCDDGPGFEQLTPRPHLDASGGYGLVLLDRLSDRWGVARNGVFCVWFEVERARHH